VTFLFFLISGLIYSYPLTDSSSFIKNKKNLPYKSNVSIGLGIVIEKSYFDKIYSSTNFNLELNIHLGKGYFIGSGLNHHSVPVNLSNKATYLYLYFSKGFYLIRNLSIYPGAGGIIGASTKGHPGCCLGGAFFAVNLSYDVLDFLSFGINTHLFTDFDDVTTIPGARVIARF
jgi:hypothetical protein